MAAKTGARVLILTNYAGGYSASQRFRFEQYLDALTAAGLDVRVKSFFSADMWPVLRAPGHFLRKVAAVARGWAGRLLVAATARRYDYVFVHLEAAPIGPPLIEALCIWQGCRLVYDIDDAIFIPRTSTANRAAAWFRWRSKVAWIAQRAWKVTGCNSFLVDWARQFNSNVVLVPTTIDPEYHRRSRPHGSEPRPIIGWTGSRSNLAYLDLVIPALRRLEERYDFEFRVICDVSPGDPGLRHFSFVPWRLESEIDDLQALDIGLMPVPDGLWEKGKVGFKGIQYSALETVPVASNVASGPEVVRDGETGFLVDNTEQDWYRALSWLLDHRERWAEIGAAARQHILARYSVPAQAATYIGLFS